MVRNNEPEQMAVNARIRSLVRCATLGKTRLPLTGFFFATITQDMPLEEPSAILSFCCSAVRDMIEVTL